METEFKAAYSTREGNGFGFFKVPFVWKTGNGTHIAAAGAAVTSRWFLLPVDDW